MTIFEALREDHEHQRTLLDELVKTHGDSSERERLFTEIKQALHVHAIAEERNLYVPLMQADLTQEKARHSVAEHKELEDLVTHLEKTEFSSPGWLPGAEKLRERVFHHLAEEEQEVFQLAGKVLSETQKTELAASYRSAMKTRTESVSK